MSEVKDWNPTDASNTTLGSISLSEGFTTIDQGNDIPRALMGAVARQLGEINAQSSSLASAATTNLASATGWYLSITGTTAITSFGTNTAGHLYILVFSSALVLTQNSTSLILPGAANITTAAGDVAFMMSLGGSNWRCVGYQRASGSLNSTRLRLTATNDVSPSSTAHPFQIGADSGLNLRMDNNQIQVVNNGVADSLYLNSEGGNVGIGTAGYTTSFPGGLSTPLDIQAVGTVGGSEIVSTGPISAYNVSALPAGGNANCGFYGSNAGMGVFFGSGAPTLSAAKGSLYLRSNGTTTNNRMYVNTNGSTTWTAVTTDA